MKPADLAEKSVGPRSRKGEQTRARLVEAAKGVFEEHGFREARISDISERAGLSHGSFYHYFESKEEVFREVVDALQDRLSSHAVIDSGLLDASEVPVLERVRASNRRYLEDYRDEARIMGVIEHVARYDADVRAARLQRQLHYTRQTAAAIERLQGLGLADPELDPTVVASALTAMVARFAEMWLVQGVVDTDLDAAVEHLSTMCANALRLRVDG